MLSVRMVQNMLVLLAMSVPFSAALSSKEQAPLVSNTSSADFSSITAGTAKFVQAEPEWDEETDNNNNNEPTSFYINLDPKFDPLTVVKNGGKAHIIASWVFFSIFTLLACWLGYETFRNRKDMTKLDQSQTAINLVLVALIGLCLFSIPISIFNGQGLVAMEDGKMYHTNENQLMYDEYFVPFMVVGAVAAAGLIVNLYLQWYVVNPRQLEGGQETTPGGKRPRRHELDYLKYYFTASIIVFAHFLRKNVTTDGLCDTMTIFGSMHWMVGFAIFTGYNAPVRYSDWIPRRTTRIFGFIFIYLLAQAMQILFVYLVVIPMIMDRLQGEAMENKIQEVNPFCGYGEISGCSPEYLSLHDFSMYLVYIPGHSLWYIKALFMWMVMLPAWLNLKLPLTFAFVACLSNKYFGNRGVNEFVGVLASSGAADYWPFVVLGGMVKFYNYDTKFYSHIKSKSGQIAGAAVIALTLFFSFACPFNLNWMNAFFPMTAEFKKTLHDDMWWYSFGLLGQMVLSSALVVGMIGVSPSYPSYFTRAAGFSLGAYILHFYVVLPLMATNFYDDDRNWSLYRPLFWKCIILGGVTSTVLMHPPIGKKLAYLVAPPMGWMYVNDKKKNKADPKKAAAEKDFAQLAKQGAFGDIVNASRASLSDLDTQKAKGKLLFEDEKDDIVAPLIKT